MKPSSITILATQFIILFLYNTQVNSFINPENIVETKQGKIKGILSKSAGTGRTFLEFKGIPYAEPPIGDLRFEPPVPTTKWEEIRESKYSEPCLQINAFDSEIIEGSEDCLYLNVFTPLVESQEKLPVLVWINGGAFQFESGADYGPLYWMDKNVILVTFNHRLGILGFYKSPDGKIVQGNMGLKDQVLVLQWVQQNIKYFNGDSNRVTIMGVNSGGVSVHLHILSPLSRNLFSSAVSQSGNALSPWAIVKENLTKRLQKVLNNCKNETNEQLVECLKGIDAKEIVRVQPGFVDWYIDPIVPFGPVIEEPNENAFLTRSPFRIIKEENYQNVPWIVGVNSDEELIHSADIVKSVILTRVLDIEWNQAAPITLLYRRSSMDLNSTSDRIRNYYIGGKNVRIGLESLKNLTDMYSDRYFFHPTHHAAKLMGSKSESIIYSYLFKEKGSQSIVEMFKTSENNTNIPEKAVSHYDQLQFLFNTPFFKKDESTTEVDVKIREKMLNTFTEFIETGKVKEWTKVDNSEELKYNLLGSSDEEAVSEKWSERVKFWDSLGLLELNREIDNEMIKKLTEKIEL